MDPARNLLHLGLSTADTVLSRTLDVVRLIDGFVVATAAPPAREESTRSRWPDPEEGDLGAASEALLARHVSVHPPHIRDAALRPVAEPSVTPPAPASTAPAKKTPAKKAPAKKTAAKKAPAKKAAATKTTTATTP